MTTDHIKSSRWPHLGFVFHSAFWLFRRFSGLYWLVDGLIIASWRREDLSPWKVSNAQRPPSLPMVLHFQTHWLPLEVPRLRSAPGPSIWMHHCQTRRTERCMYAPIVVFACQLLPCHQTFPSWPLCVEVVPRLRPTRSGGYSGSSSVQDITPTTPNGNQERCSPRSHARPL